MHGHKKTVSILTGKKPAQLTDVLLLSRSVFAVINVFKGVQQP